jgi:(E)-4-hydroxy-3-methylbut-2-enyl-diphosphate synthase
VNTATYPLPRRHTRQVRVGKLLIGGDATITVQSMTKVPTHDVDAVIAQIDDVQAAGCDIIRLGVPDKKAALALAEIKKRAGIPIVADIHFDHELALIAIDAGVDKLRLNPGNIKKPEFIKKIVTSAAAAKIPIRIGVNNGSIPHELRDKYPFTPDGNADALVECAISHITILEELGFQDIVVSLKASDIVTTVLAYRKMAIIRDYPLHIGITEAGLAPTGLIRSAVGIGQLLAEGIGDTLRVSLTGAPVAEVEAGWSILQSLNMRPGGIIITSCPTCARCDINLEAITLELTRETESISRKLRAAGKSLHVAVMGCEVNGPGEARDADLGIAGGMHSGLLIKNGETIIRIKETDFVSRLLKEIDTAVEGLM